MPTSSTPSPPTTSRIQFRIKRSQLRLVRSGRHEQTSDTNSSSRDVSVRSSGVAMSSDASTTSITGSGIRQSSAAQPKLLGRRWSCGTPLPREDADDLSDVDNINTVSTNNLKEEPDNSRCRIEGFVNEPEVDFLHQRLPNIDQRPVSRHVVYTLQYDGRTKSSLSTTKSATTPSSFDSPRTLRQKALQIDLNETKALTQQDRDIKTKSARRANFPDDQFIDQWTKNHIMNWLENVETALTEDSVDSTTLTAIEEETL